MSRLLVKICGVTTVEDARLCRSAGADLLGVILAPSPRRISVARATAIREAVPGAKLVGVFTDAAPEAIAVAADAAGLDLIQLHGCDDPARWAAVARAAGRPVIPAVTADRAEAASRSLAADPGLDVPVLLLDLPKRQAVGAATLRDHLWRTARQLADRGLSVLLAGALDVADVPAARRRVQPAGLDVCRSTESAPGVKDPDKVVCFVTAAREPEVNHAS